MERSTIENKFKWTIDEMYPNEESIEKDIQKVKELIEEVKRYKGILADSEENIFKALNISEEASRILQNLYVYTHMKSHEDTRINKNQSNATKTDMLSTELSMATSYMVPEIIAMDNEKLENYLKTEKLSHYKKYVDDILRLKPHTLNEREEELLAAVADLSGVPENVYDMLSFADLQFPEIEDENGEKVRVTHSNFSLFLKSKDATAHAEVNAIREASKVLNTHDLSGCILYTSAEPCPMCLSAIIWANIKEVYYANTKEEAHEIGFRDDIIYEHIKGNNKDLINLHKLDEETAKEAFDSFKNSLDKEIY